MKEKILGLLKTKKDFLSGQEISEKLGVSRTTVWKAIRQLENEGYVIKAVRNKGYSLVSEPDLLTDRQVKSCLKTSWAGSELLVLDSIDSTNNEAKRRAEAGAPHGLLVVAEEQTAGRGRRGRVWESEKGDGIFMTLVLKPDVEPGHASMLTLVMAMAVQRALQNTAHVNTAIKWPNDIICDGKKMAGILTEMSAQVDCINHIVIGVGINVHHASFPEPVDQTATSVFQQTGVHIRRAELIAEVMAQFERYYAVYLETENLQNLVDDYNRHLINCDRRVRVLDPKQEYEGTALGINIAGELLVKTDTGIVPVSAGEVSVRGVYGYV